MRLSSSSLTFAGQTVGTTSAPQKITVTNTGSTALSISTIAVGKNFGETNTCGTKLSAGASCTVSVTFSPVYIGTAAGHLEHFRWRPDQPADRQPERNGACEIAYQDGEPCRVQLAGSPPLFDVLPRLICCARIGRSPILHPEILRMRHTLLVCLFLCALRWAQNDACYARASSSVADAAPVITIKGLCGEAATGLAADTTNNPCQTVITREAFEKLAAVIQANMTPESKRQLAERLPQLLVMTHQAEQLGLDRQEHFQKMIAYARLQILAQELNHKLQEKAAQVSAQEIDDYYHKYSEAFERATLERILIPNFKQPDVCGQPAET